jgi:hypothetical protein
LCNNTVPPADSNNSRRLSISATSDVVIYSVIERLNTIDVESLRKPVAGLTATTLMQVASAGLDTGNSSTSGAGALSPMSYSIVATYVQVTLGVGGSVIPRPSQSPADTGSNSDSKSTFSMTLPVGIVVGAVLFVGIAIGVGIGVSRALPGKKKKNVNLMTRTASIRCRPRYAAASVFLPVCFWTPPVRRCSPSQL